MRTLLFHCIREESGVKMDVMAMTDVEFEEYFKREWAEATEELRETLKAREESSKDEQ